MAELEPPDTHLLLHAIGWLELGNHREAEAELAQIAAPFQRHPAVLAVRWQISERAQDWDKALEAARELIQEAPESASGWIHQAYSLRRVRGGGLQAAWDALLPAAEKFPKEPIIPYNLACYAAQQGRLDEAWTWLQRAMKVGTRQRIKKMALADTDLEPLWERLRRLKS
jgi:predicted Zn-dependent protease